MTIEQVKKEIEKLKVSDGAEGCYEFVVQEEVLQILSQVDTGKCPKEKCEWFFERFVDNGKRCKCKRNPKDKFQPKKEIKE